MSSASLSDTILNCKCLQKHNAVGVENTLRKRKYTPVELPWDFHLFGPKFHDKLSFNIPAKISSFW